MQGTLGSMGNKRKCPNNTTKWESWWLGQNENEIDTFRHWTKKKPLQESLDFEITLYCPLFYLSFQKCLTSLFIISKEAFTKTNRILKESLENKNKISNNFSMLFSWCSGYHICLTHRRSPVRSRAKTLPF